MRSWRTVLALLVGTALTVATVVHRQDLAMAASRIANLSPAWLTLLGITAMVTVVSAGWAVGAVHPGLTLGRSITVHQATIAANNTVVASGPVSLALRISMLRSWRLSDSAIAVSVVASNVVSSFRLWFMALAVAIIGATGTATEVLDRWVFVTVAVVAVAVLTLSGLWWWFVIRHPHIAGWFTAWAQRLLVRLRRRFQRLPDVDLVKAVDAFRRDVTDLVRHHRRRIMTSSVLEMIVLLGTPVLVARAFGISNSVVSTAEIVLAFGMVRLASALSPIPGGIGISEVGATLLLARFGAPEPAVLATVITHRAITFLMPLIVGGVCLGLWHRRSRRTVMVKELV